MKVYGDLIVRGDPQMLAAFVSALDQHLTNGWSRHRERESEVQRAALGPMYCFRCTALYERPACELWLATNPDRHLYVSNILAQEFSSLTYDQYNQVLSDYYVHCVRPAAEISSVQVELGKTSPEIEDFVTPQTARLLRSSLSNRSVVHPLDRRRWNAFITAAHRERAKLTGGMLQRWLIEEERWPEDEAINLATEYEHSRDLLETYESLPA
ncbi:MAG: hypothetical protein IT168_25085 [Bryobacterales bacterium]|nr:hypothetical protein [Bryobacterales bacterium]